MEKIKVALLIFLILFIIIFLVDYLFIKRKYLKRIKGKKKSKKNNELTEISYLVGKFKLDKEKLPLNQLLLFISACNAFIISLVSVVVLIIKVHIIIQFLIGFILLLALIYALYELMGRYLERRGYVKNGK